MKYDFSRCNNLRWEYKNEKGMCIIYKCNDGDRLAFTQNVVGFDGLSKICLYTTYRLDASFDHTDFLDGLKFVPRDPETYTDWQVGDVVSIDEFDEIDLRVVVAARINDIVICKYIKENMVFGMFTCEELKKKGSLVLTDYEKELAGKLKYMFNQGDKVLARDTDEYGVWYAGKFYGMSEFDDVPYSVCLGFEKKPYNFPECIPYNEKTWRLLGTTDEYKKNE